MSTQFRTQRSAERTASFLTRTTGQQWEVVKGERGYQVAPATR